MLPTFHWSTLSAPVFLLLLITSILSERAVAADSGTVSVSISKDNTGLVDVRDYMVLPVNDMTSLQTKVAIFMVVQMVLTAAMVLASNQVYKMRQEEYYKRVFKLNGLVIRHYESKYGPLIED